MTEMWPEPHEALGDGSNEGESDVNDFTPGAVGSEEALRRRYLATESDRDVAGRLRAVWGRVKAAATAHDAAPVVRRATLKLAAWPNYPSPNYSSRKSAKVRLIIVHTAEGARTREALGGFFAKAATGASSHVGIDDTGITRYVPDAYSAWTARNANPVSVQAELCAFTAWTAVEWVKHPGMIENTARWIAQASIDHGIPIVRLTPEQSVKGTGVCAHWDITRGWKIGSHIDAGTQFPWDAVIARARQIAGGGGDDEEWLKVDVANPYANDGKGGTESASVALGYMEQRIRNGVMKDLPPLVTAAVAESLPGLVATSVKAALADVFAGLPKSTTDELLNRKLPTPTYRNGVVDSESTRIEEILPRAAEASITRHRDEDAVKQS